MYPSRFYLVHNGDAFASKATTVAAQPTPNLLLDGHSQYVTNKMSPANCVMKSLFGEQCVLDQREPLLSSTRERIQHRSEFGWNLGTHIQHIATTRLPLIFIALLTFVGGERSRTIIKARRADCEGKESSVHFKDKWCAIAR